MTLGELQYLITVNDRTDDGVRKSEGKIKKAEKQLTAFGIARAQMVMDFAKKAASTAVNAFKNTVKSAVSAYADYEQLVGGVETLFKDSAIKVQKYAAQAYKTVGISANEYMENVTSFSASLLQSLGGDTSKAADVADMAMKDMADNANKMGSSMESIQNAYQGFAKQNYTMLDNLKLGYGGTKSEMERLLKDAEKLTGKKYNLNNLSDVYEAIHAIQQEMGITGTTALEAEKTISGSMNMTKAAWKDLLTAIGSGRDVKKATKNFTQSLKQTLKNIVPVVKTSIKGLFEAVKAAMPDIKEALGDIWKSIKQSLPKNNIFSKLAEKVEDAMGFVKLLTDMINDFSGTIEKLKNSDSPILHGIAKIAELADLLIKKINKGVGETGSLLFGTIQGVSEFIAEAMEELANWLSKQENVQKIGTMVANFIDAIAKSATPIMNSLAKVLNEAIPVIATAISNLFNDESFIKSIEKLAATLAKAIYKILFGGSDETDTAGNNEMLEAMGMSSGGSPEPEITPVAASPTVTKPGATGATGKGTQKGTGKESSSAAQGEKLSIKPVGAEPTINPSGKSTQVSSGNYAKAAGSRGRIKVEEGLKTVLAHPEIANTSGNLFGFGATMAMASKGGLTGITAALLGYPLVAGLQDHFGERYQKQQQYFEDLDAALNGGEKRNWFQRGFDGVKKSIEDSAGELKLKAATAAAGFAVDVIKAGENVKTALEIGGDYIAGLWEGLSNGGATTNGANGGVEFGGGGVMKPMEQAKGNWTVPYDNYPSLLHRGEMVLTKSQARQFRDGVSGGGISGDALASAVEAAMSRVYVMLSGEKVGDLTTRRIKKNINASSYARMRALGG